MRGISEKMLSIPPRPFVPSAVKSSSQIGITAKDADVRGSWDPSFDMFGPKTDSDHSGGDASQRGELFREFHHSGWIRRLS